MSDLSQLQARAVNELLRVSPIIAELGALFHSAGHSLYLVGGSVRDALLGKLGNDLDFTTSARPDEIETLLHRFSPSVWTIGKEFGTVSATKESQGRQWLIEVTTFRAEIYREDSRKPLVSFGDGIIADLERRDFTINAMAIEVVDQEFVDPFNGINDLADQVIRTPASAELSFSDDPLRIMRAARFAAQLGFIIADEVRQAMTDMAGRLEIVSAERIRDELSKMLLTNDPVSGLEALVSTSVAEVVLPELPAMRDTVDEHRRHKDVYAHSLTVLRQGIDLEKARNHDPDLILRLALILHDIGKPATRRFEAGGKVTFYHHDIVGAKLAAKRLKALHYSSEVVKAVAKLIELHLRFHGYGEGQWTDSAVRRYVRDAGDQLERLHILTRADCTTRNRAKAERLRRAYEELEWRIDELEKEEELNAIRPELDGNQIMEVLGIGPGREVGQAYQFLLNLRIEEGPIGSEAATKRLLQWWSESLLKP